MGRAGTAARVVAVALCLVPGLAHAPAAAALFNSTSQAATSISTATMGAVDATAGCVRNPSYFTVTISHGPEPVPYANYVDLKVTDPRGAVVFWGDLNGHPGLSYSTTPKINDGKGTWNYEIQAQYRVPGSPTIWNGPRLQGTFTCVV